MTISHMLQRIALCVLTSEESTPEERESADNILHSLLTREDYEDGNHFILCHAALTPSLETIYKISLYDIQSVQEMEYIPLWDVLLEEINRGIDWTVKTAAETKEESIFLSSYWRYSHRQWACCLSKYPDAVLKGLRVMKQEFPSPLPWRVYKDYLLHAQIYDAAPLGIIYRMLTQNAEKKISWTGNNLKTSMHIDATSLPNSLDSTQAAELLRRPDVLRFLSALELYARLKDCQCALRGENVLRSKRLILAEYKMTRPKPLPQPSNTEESVFIDFDDDKPLPWSK